MVRQVYKACVGLAYGSARCIAVRVWPLAEGLRVGKVAAKHVRVPPLLAFPEPISQADITASRNLETNVNEGHLPVSSRPEYLAQANHASLNRPYRSSVSRERPRARLSDCANYS